MSPSWKTLGLLLLLAANGWAQSPRHPHTAGLAGSFTTDYDGSRHRTSPMHFGAEAQWGSSESWISLSLDAYTDLTGPWSMAEDGYATLQIGRALYRNNDKRLYLNATLDLDLHSTLASGGADLTPEIGVAKGLTEDWWIGGNLGAVLATSPDEGNRTGYASATLWIVWLCELLPDDGLTLSLWAATNEIPGDDNALFLSLEYEFSLTDDLEASFGIGADPVSPWDHLGVFATAGFTWRF